MALYSQQMKLDYIRSFTVLGQSSNMTEAAERLGVTPSYISRHIQKLESGLGTKLIIPGPKNKPLQLTEAGKYFFQKYEKIYNDILLAEKNFKQTEQLDNCKITIGVNSDLEEKILKPKMFQFIEKYPNICIKVINGDKDILMKKLLQYTLDFIIDKDAPETSTKLQDIETQIVSKSNYCFVYNPKYFSDDLDFNNIPFILPVSKTPERALVTDYFKSKNIKPNIRYELDTANKILSYVKDGFGIGFVLKTAIKDDEKFKIIDVDITCDITVSYIKEKITPSTKEFIKLFNLDF